MLDATFSNLYQVTKQNSLPSKNTESSHNQQAKQNQKQTTFNPHNQNNQRYLQQEERNSHYSEQQNP
jgi:hypothetical protein